MYSLQVVGVSLTATQRFRTLTRTAPDRVFEPEQIPFRERRPYVRR